MAQTHNADSSIRRGGSYISESIAELKKVNFPTRQETIQATIVTIFIVMFVSLSLFLLDVVFSQLMTAVLG